MNEMGAMDDIHRAQEAAHVLEHPMVVEALAAMRADLYAKLEATKPSQKDEREFIYQQLQANNLFEARFRFHIDNGRMAVSWLDEYRARKVAKAKR